MPVFFKGSGFYSTDYGRGKRKKETGEGDGPPAKTDEGAKKAEDKKPAAEKSSASD